MVKWHPQDIPMIWPSHWIKPRHGDCATEGAMEGAQEAAMDMVSKTPPCVELAGKFQKTKVIIVI